MHSAHPFRCGAPGGEKKERGCGGKRWRGSVWQRSRQWHPAIYVRKCEKSAHESARIFTHLLAPMITIFPLANTSAVVRGSLIRKMRAWNFCPPPITVTGEGDVRGSGRSEGKGRSMSVPRPILGKGVTVSVGHDLSGAQTVLRCSRREPAASDASDLCCAMQGCRRLHQQVTAVSRHQPTTDLGIVLQVLCFEGRRLQVQRTLQVCRGYHVPDSGGQGYRDDEDCMSSNPSNIILSLVCSRSVSGHGGQSMVCGIRSR